MLLRADDVKQILNVSKPMSYKVIRILNEELKKDGYLTIQGRIPVDYLATRYKLDEEEIKKQVAIIEK
ncbi:LysR family transcriptional regulator [Anaerococcus tetradius]|uniref:LysR family transcriptional regulator n=1 Tax=Anaerococcus tetradius TaxID=33036 RepID=UPI003C6C4840